VPAELFQTKSTHQDQTSQAGGLVSPGIPEEKPVEKRFSLKVTRNRNWKQENKQASNGDCENGETINGKL